MILKMTLIWFLKCFKKHFCRHLKIDVDLMTKLFKNIFFVFVCCAVQNFFCLKFSSITAFFLLIDMQYKVITCEAGGSGDRY